MERKIKVIGHLLNHNDFFNNIFEGRTMGRRSRGRPKANFFHDIKEKMGSTSYQQLKEAAKKRCT